MWLGHHNERHYTLRLGQGSPSSILNTPSNPFLCRTTSNFWNESIWHPSSCGVLTTITSPTAEQSMKSRCSNPWDRRALFKGNLKRKLMAQSSLALWSIFRCCLLTQIGWVVWTNTRKDADLPASLCTWWPLLFLLGKAVFLLWRGNICEPRYSSHSIFPLGTRRLKPSSCILTSRQNPRPKFKYKIADLAATARRLAWPLAPPPLHSLHTKSSTLSFQEEKRRRKGSSLNSSRTANNQGVVGQILPHPLYTLPLPPILNPEASVQPEWTSLAKQNCNFHLILSSASKDQIHLQ